MRGITSSELAVLVGELKQFEGSYLDNFYEQGEGRFRLRLSKSKEQINITVILSHAINRTKYMEKSDAATNFAMAVRKRVSGAKIEKIRQINDDRIVLFELKKKDEALGLIFEMFGKGNLIIVNHPDNEILLTYTNQQSADRTIKKGEVYKPPKQPENYKLEISKLVHPIIYRKGGKAVDYSIKENEKYKDLEKQEYPTLAEALDEFYYENPIMEKEETTAQQKLIEELEKSIKKQENILKSIMDDVEENKNKGKAIFDNMIELNRMIKTMQANKRMTKEELQKLFKIKVLNVDLKDKKVKLEL